MIKVAVLDDYQNIFREFVDIDKYKSKFDFKIFTKPFQNEDEALLELENFDAILVMRERTKISKTLIMGIKNLKYIITSGMRNKAIDLEEAKKRMADKTFKPERDEDGFIKSIATDQIKNILKYGLPVKSTYAGLSQIGVGGLKYLLYNQLR